MARKNVLKGLLDGAKSPPDQALTTPNPAPLPRSSGGAVGAVSRSIADLKARAILDLDPNMILAGGVQDRLDADAEEDNELRRSLSEYGQQVPVLVRPHPEREGYYQIVYGRRRVLAMRDLGQSVKALVRDLDDQALVMAQGQENTLRRNLSYIEKVNFARQMEEAGYDRKFICDAISVDKTQISRMLSITERISPELIAQIG
jgi:ParB family transcriptional regulator, chromosome partitioning protein